MGIKKTNMKLKNIFIRYILTICIGVIIVAGIFAFVISLFLKYNIILPANYSENIIHDSKKNIQNAEIVTEKIIPYGCKYALFSKDYKVIKSNLDSEHLLEAKEYIKGKYRTVGVKNYLSIERTKEICVIQYYVTPQYGTKFLQKYFPGVQTLGIILFVITIIIIIIITSRFFGKKLNERLMILTNATNKIKDKNLDFEINYSGIQEIDDVIFSLHDMKNDLKKSLEKQWKLEESRKRQIASLAHDIKTPITIIKGNGELLYEEENLTNTQREFSKYIVKSVNKIEKYMKFLIEISTTENENAINIKKVNLKEFIENVKEEAKAMGISKNIKWNFEINILSEYIKIDKKLLLRAIENIVSNAVYHVSEKKKVKLSLKEEKDEFEITIEDSGKGFSKEAKEFALNLFFMGDKSRTTKGHYGMGLFIANNIVKLHKGTIILSNSRDTGGAKVTINIPK